MHILTTVCAINCPPGFYRIKSVHYNQYGTVINMEGDEAGCIGIGVHEFKGLYDKDKV